MALKRAVESKSAAISILQLDLEECQKERDKFMSLTNHKSLNSIKPTPKVCIIFMIELCLTKF